MIELKAQKKEENENGILKFLFFRLLFNYLTFFLNN